MPARRAPSPLLMLGMVLLLCLPGGAARLPAQAAGGVTSFEGVASWYGAAFQGRLTANGERYDKEGLTAAHRSLPFGTLLRVTSLDTGASVVVRVNDRGPFVEGRVLDLSEAAARLIGLVATGTGRVSCRVLAPEEAASFGSPRPAPPAPPSAPAPLPATGEFFRVQVASYRDEANARATLERLRMAGLSAVIEASGAYNRVVFPAVPLSEGEALAARLRALGYRGLLLTRYSTQGR